MIEWNGLERQCHHLKTSNYLNHLVNLNLIINVPKFQKYQIPKSHHYFNLLHRADMTKREKVILFSICTVEPVRAPQNCDFSLWGRCPKKNSFTKILSKIFRLQRANFLSNKFEENFFFGHPPPP